MKTSNAPSIFLNGYLQNQSTKPSIVARLTTGLQHLFSFLNSKSEPRVWTTTDRYGNIFWHAYDPVSDRSTSLCSETEIRIWLEQRYYK